MNKVKENNNRKERRHGRVRAKVSGTGARPRLSVFRSNKGLYLQLIDDSKGATIVSVHTKELDATKGSKVEQAFLMGKAIAEKALAKNIKQVVFDRGSYKYHGRTEAVAQGAREGGLEF